MRQNVYIYFWNLHLKFQTYIRPIVVKHLSVEHMQKSAVVGMKEKVVHLPVEHMWKSVVVGMKENVVIMALSYIYVYFVTV